MTAVKAFVGRRLFRGPMAGYYDQDHAANLQASLADVLGNLKKWISHVKGQTPQIVKEALEPTLELAEYYCPKDTEALVNSSYLVARTFRGNAQAEIGFAKGGDPDYAIYVHERTDLEHQSPTRSKFLQHAVEEDFDLIGERVAELAAVAGGTR